MEWSKIQRGQSTSSRLPNVPSQPGEVIVLEQTPRTQGIGNKPVRASQAARAANQVLDD
jgi:hypothetical protein